VGGRERGRGGGGEEEGWSRQRQSFGLDRGGRKGNERGKGREERGAEVAPPSRNGELVPSSGGGRRVGGWREAGGSSGALVSCVKSKAQRKNQ
jgi:hypothetical protein